MTQEQIQEIRQRIMGDGEGLFIRRVPPKTKEKFMKIAEEEFCGDWGMTLKWLLDDMEAFHNVAQSVEQLSNRVQTIEVMLSGAETKEEVETVKHMLNGKMLKVGQ